MLAASPSAIENGPSSLLEVHPAQPPLVVLEVIQANPLTASSALAPDSLNQRGGIIVRRKTGEEEAGADGTQCQEAAVELVPLTWEVVSRVPYVAAALAHEWRRPSQWLDRDESQIVKAVHSETSSAGRIVHVAPAVVQVFLPPGCPCGVVRVLVARLAADSGAARCGQGMLVGSASSVAAADASVPAQSPLALRWKPTDLHTALRLVQVSSMLQIEELLPELVDLVRAAIVTDDDFATLETAIASLELPPALRDAAEVMRPPAEPPCLPNEMQVRGMIASALLTADGKVWRVVQKVIDRREAWPRTAKENALVLLAFANGVHGSIRATPHTGFFWGSRDFLYLVCRYIRARSEHFDAMVSAMFDSVYSMDPELPAEIIDAVFKELLSHEGLTFSQCEHVIAKLMQRSDQLVYLFHEWSGVFPTLPAAARRALAKGLLPAVGHCPHAALDFVLKELDAAPSPAWRPVRGGRALASVWRGFQLLRGSAERESDEEDQASRGLCCGRRRSLGAVSGAAAAAGARAAIGGHAAGAVRRLPDTSDAQQS